MLDPPDAPLCDGFQGGWQVENRPIVPVDAAAAPLPFEFSPAVFVWLPPPVCSRHAQDGPAGWPPPTTAHRHVWLRIFQC